MNQKLTLAAAALVLLTACSPSGSSAAYQIAALEARVAALEAASGQDPPAEAGVFELAVAQYVMDTAGFHSMDEALNETGVVEAAYLSTVNRVAKIVGATPWPADLHAPLEAFQTALADFTAALEADDAATAAGLAATVHDTQHDLSHAIDEHLGAGGHGDE
jgi:hypothetical protein